MQPWREETPADGPASQKRFVIAASHLHAPFTPHGIEQNTNLLRWLVLFGSVEKSTHVHNSQLSPSVWVSPWPGPHTARSLLARLRRIGSQRNSLHALSFLWDLTACCCNLPIQRPPTKQHFCLPLLKKRPLWGARQQGWAGLGGPFLVTKHSMLVQSVFLSFFHAASKNLPVSFFTARERAVLDLESRVSANHECTTAGSDPQRCAGPWFYSLDLQGPWIHSPWTYSPLNPQPLDLQCQDAQFLDPQFLGLQFVDPHPQIHTPRSTPPDPQPLHPQQLHPQPDVCSHWVSLNPHSNGPSGPWIHSPWIRMSPARRINARSPCWTRSNGLLSRSRTPTVCCRQNPSGAAPVASPGQGTGTRPEPSRSGGPGAGPGVRGSKSCAVRLNLGIQTGHT